MNRLKKRGDLLNSKPHTVSTWVSHLNDLGFVNLEIIKDDRGEIKQLRIYPNDTPYVINKTYPYTIFKTEGMSQKRQYNNININNNIHNKDEPKKEEPKIRYAECVFMTESDYKKLIDDFGEQN